MSSKDKLTKRVQAFNSATGSSGLNLTLHGGEVDRDYDIIDFAAFILDPQKGRAILEFEGGETYTFILEEKGDE